MNINSAHGMLYSHQTFFFPSPPKNKDGWPARLHSSQLTSIDHMDNSLDLKLDEGEACNQLKLTVTAFSVITGHGFWSH